MSPAIVKTRQVTASVFYRSMGIRAATGSDIVCSGSRQLIDAVT
jgi:hypothetical protein